MKESDIQKSILDYLKYRGVFHQKVNNVGIYKKTTGTYIPSPVLGASDIICCIKGRMIGLEVKQRKGRVSDHQAEYGRKLMAAGGLYYIVHSLDEAVDAIEPLLREDVDSFTGNPKV